MDYSLWLIAVVLLVCLVSVYRSREVWVYEIQLALNGHSCGAASSQILLRTKTPPQESQPKSPKQQDLNLEEPEPKSPFATKPTADWNPPRASVLFESMDEETVCLVNCLKITRTRSVYYDPRPRSRPHALHQDSQIIFKIRGTDITKKLLNQRLAAPRPVSLPQVIQQRRKQTYFQA